MCRPCRRRTATKEERCAICGERRRVCWRSPIGAVCERCRDRRLRERAVCSRCGERRRPAIFPPAAVLCASCAGLAPERSCRDCGGEDEHAEGGRCALRRRVAALAASGDLGAVSRLGPYLHALAASRTPRSAVMWLRYSPTAELLAGELELSHEALDERDGTGTTAVTFLRAAFVEHGILPERPEGVVRLKRFVRERLETLPDNPDRALVRAYATWKVTRDLTDRVRSGKAGRSAPALARSKIRRAIELTRWLHDRQLTLADLRQDLVDEWLAQGIGTRWRIGDFVAWLRTSGVIGALEVSRPAVREPTKPVADRERLARVARLLADEELDLADRVAGCLVLLYAQPVARVARLRSEHVDERDGRVIVTLGRQPAPLPRPLGELILRCEPSGSGPP